MKTKALLGQSYHRLYSLYLNFVIPLSLRELKQHKTKVINNATFCCLLSLDYLAAKDNHLNILLSCFTTDIINHCPSIVGF